MLLSQRLMVLASAGFMATAAHAAPINIRCLSAAGFYGAASLLEADGVVHISLKGGLGLSPDQVATDLGLVAADRPQFLTTLTFDLPVSACKTLASDPVVALCEGENVELTFSGDTVIKATVANAAIELSKVVRTSVDSVTNGVLVNFNAYSQDPNQATKVGATSQEFHLMPSLPSEGCNSI